MERNEPSTEFARILKKKKQTEWFWSSGALSMQYPLRCVHVVPRYSIRVHCWAKTRVFASRRKFAQIFKPANSRPAHSMQCKSCIRSKPSQNCTFQQFTFDHFVSFAGGKHRQFGRPNITKCQFVNIQKYCTNYPMEIILGLNESTD